LRIVPADLFNKTGEVLWRLGCDRLDIALLLEGVKYSSNLEDKEIARLDENIVLFKRLLVLDGADDL
jgi:hypothetical protein